MTADEEDAIDAIEIPLMAVEALNAATRRALASGLPVILIENDELIRIDSSGRTVLKKVPPPIKVNARSKRMSHE